MSGVHIQLTSHRFGKLTCARAGLSLMARDGTYRVNGERRAMTDVIRMTLRLDKAWPGEMRRCESHTTIIPMQLTLPRMRVNMSIQLRRR